MSRLFLGSPTTIESYADRTPYAAVFEDDGRVAYFHAIDTRLGDRGMLDALCVYEVMPLVTRPNPPLDAYHAYDVRIVWSADQTQVALLLDGEPHAAFDFTAHRSCCRSNFPATSSWNPTGHAWDSQVVKFLAALPPDVPQPPERVTLPP